MDVENPVITVENLNEVREWSRETFGPNARHQGVIAHIEKELEEIKEDPEDLNEWIDVAILAFDGAWRAGHEPETILTALKEKWAKNMRRSWPDWRDVKDDTPIEHIKGIHD